MDKETTPAQQPLDQAGVNHRLASRSKANVALCLRWVITVVLSIALFEGLCQLIYRQKFKVWRFAREDFTTQMFKPHPYLVGVPMPAVRDTRNDKAIAHNRQGFRGDEDVAAKGEGVIRVVTLGGSTTYCTGVSQEHTWQRYLAAELGAGYQVINLGVPGYTTVENLHQSAFWFSELKPDIAVYYEGWNDARNMHIRGLTSDYADYHGNRQFYNLRLHKPDRKAQRSAAMYYVERILAGVVSKYYFPRIQTQLAAGASTDQIDAYALRLYQRNLTLIAGICRVQSVRAIYVPQILNYDILVHDRPSDWMPYVNQSSLKDVMAAYNQTMKQVAVDESIAYSEEVLGEKFEKADFVDEGHFSPQGNRKFAHAMAVCIRRSQGAAMADLDRQATDTANVSVHGNP